jgi:hypothetical protein
MKHAIFREIPPWTIVAEVLSLLKLSTEPPFTFQKSAVDLSRSPDAVDLLAPYYLPCKATQFLEFTDEKRWITILRHILTPHGYVLISHETTRDKKKVIMYSVERVSVVEGPLRQAVKIDFS